MKTRIAIFLSLAVIGFAPTADAGPFRDFFRKVRHAINHPEKSSQSHRAAQKHTSGTQPRDGSVNAPDDHSMVSSPPSAKNTRTASAANKSKNSDLPYGTPVPGKKGFVTSPFAPDSGYVDVRGFNPGTEVKDPYSGKVFLTP